MRTRVTFAQTAGGLLLLLLPIVLFVVMRLDADLDATFVRIRLHFYIVTAVTLVALALSVLVGIAAYHTRDVRTLLLALGFLALSAIFLAHGLGSGDSMLMASGSPVVEGYYGDGEAHDEHEAYGYAAAGSDEEHLEHVGTVLKVSARLSLLVAALCFALAVVDMPRRLAHWIERRFIPVFLGAAALVLLYLVFAVLRPSLFAWVPVESTALSLGITVIVVGALGFAGWRFWQAYALAGLPLQGAMALGMGLLIEAQFFMVAGETWHLTWWMYHATMLAGFVVCVGALLAQYRVAGDLGAVVEGLFLRSMVGGLQHQDPRALTDLSVAVAAKDGNTGSHLERVADLSERIGRHLGLGPDELAALRWGGRLHDLGKIGIPDRLLNKPGKLTAAEFDEMKRHTIRGDAVAQRSGMLTAAAPAIRWHHERWDGSGYPDGLAGEQIPMSARIVCVADVFDALTSERSYKRAWTREEALEEIRQQRGRAFDPACVDALFAVLGVRGIAAAS